ncbi:hypothetical protein Acor_79530 [Acrocarpospora corrugata]|uniref:Barstar (barnase inhibitor) domain-containing protein n=1 Tax=Acrocarpospora corrugata TaxID=35763 RepID=A0A5M3WAF0_9ACTN|nr:barstar family protein [Acrocarpospora corrugata]GES05884.1 hypothetical protein Acor_79530 [Acrocarpospora corrugata]
MTAVRPLPQWLTVSTGRAPAVIEGRACRTRAAFFEEAARVLRFPSYFGHNWDAFADSLGDVTRAGKLTLVVEHAEDLLRAEPPEHFAALLGILAEATRTGLTVTLYTSADHEAPLRRRAAEAVS